MVIGKDTRLSGYMIESALVAGFTAVGMDVFQFGPLPTPAVAMLTRSLRADLGVMISASHNPFEDNGIKFFGPDGMKLSDEREMEIEALMTNGLEEGLADAREDRPRQAHRRCAGPLYRICQAHIPQATCALMGCVSSSIAPMVRPTRLRLPCCGNWAPTLCRSASRPMASTSIPNVAPPPPKRWPRKVREMRADFGIALDGDADRVVMADENGRIIDGDQILALIARSWSKTGISRAAAWSAQ